MFPRIAVARMAKHRVLYNILATCTISGEVGYILICQVLSIESQAHIVYLLAYISHVRRLWHGW